MGVRSSVYDFETEHLGYCLMTALVYEKPGPDADDSVALGGLDDDDACPAGLLGELHALRAGVLESRAYGAWCRAEQGMRW